MLRPVEEHEIGRLANFDQTAVERPHSRGVAGGETESDLGRNVAERRKHRDHPEDSQRLHAGARRRVGSQDHPLELVKLFGGAQREKRRTLVAVVHEFEPAPAALAKARDLTVGQRRVAAVDMADDVGVRFEHDVRINQAGAGNRRAAGVNRAVEAIFARPRDHFARRRSVLDAAQPDLAEEAHPRLRQFLEVALLHAVLDDRRAGVHLYPAGAECGERALRRDRHRFKADDVARPARRMHLARGDHGRDPAMQAGVDPTKLVLPRRPVARDRVDMAVDEARRQRDALRVDRRGRSRNVEIL